MTIFNIVWSLIIIAYPSIGLFTLFDPEFEKEMLLDSFWMVYIFGSVQVALVMFNHDIILGEAAQKLHAKTSSLLDNVTWMNSVVNVLNVLVFSGFCIFAEDDHLKWKAAQIDDSVEIEHPGGGPKEEDEPITL